VLAVPSTSISYAPYGDTVYVVETKKDASGQEIAEVRQQVVKLGERRGDFVAVESGLQAGSVIASSGTFKLRPGARVVVNNSITPKMSTSPTPADS
jgi:membrane fusion protein (multidrug efflux system)